MRSAAPINDRHPEVRAPWRASKDERPPPLPLAPGAAIAGASPFEARARALAPQGDGERESRSAAIGMRRRDGGIPAACRVTPRSDWTIAMEVPMRILRPSLSRAIALWSVV